MGRKRKDIVSPSDTVSPSEKTLSQTKAKRTKKTKMASNVLVSGNNNVSPPPVNTPANTSNIQTIQSPYVIPPVYQYPHYLSNMANSINPGSPVLTQNIPTGGTNIDPLQIIIQKLEHIDKKLGQLEKIQLAVNDITVRLNSMDTKTSEIEKSQTFLCEQYDTLSKCSSVNKEQLDNVQGVLKRLTDQNSQLQSANKYMSESITDLKCRSMRDNLMFFGISERPLPRSETDVQPESRSVSEPNIHHVSADVARPDEQLAFSHIDSPSDCAKKVHNFCKNQLHIEDADTKIHIVRAHRIGRYNSIKARPIVAKLDDDSKMLIKNALRAVNLQNTTYHVSDQYPPEVQESRRNLIPVMLKARREGKRATLVRDKLYINNELYTSDTTMPHSK